MGSCCGCCSEKAKNKAKVKPKRLTFKKKESPKNSLIKLASLRRQTASGCPVNRVVKRSLNTRKVLEGFKINPKVNPKIKQISSQPFSDFTQIDEHLFLTGFWGLSKENIDNNNIKCIISIAYEMPEFQLKGIECIRLPVSIQIDFFEHFIVLFVI